MTSALSEPVTGSLRNAKPTKRPGQSSGDTGRTSRSTTTSADSTETGWQAWDSLNDAATDLVPTMGQNTGMASGRAGVIFQSTSSAEASRAKTSQSPGNAPDSQASDPDSSLRQPESLTLFSDTADGFSLRMFPDSFPQTADEISPSYSRRWPTSGFTTSPGECWTVDSSECHSDGGAFSSLPDVLVADVPPRFYLSPKAAAGIIRRAEKRGKELPEHLDETLRLLSKQPQATTPEPTASTWSPPRAFTQNTRDEVRYIGQKGEGDHTAALAAQPGMKQTNYLHSEKMVRRLTPTECERLQGFPDGWTIP